jgi:hypothetical protein
VERQRTTEMDLHILARGDVGTLAAMVLAFVRHPAPFVRSSMYHRLGDYWLAQQRREKAETE